jgi:hypothetical protein
MGIFLSFYLFFTYGVWRYIQLAFVDREYRMLKLFRAFFELCSLNISHRATAAGEAGNHPAPRRALLTVLSHNKYHHGWLGV